MFEAHDKDNRHDRLKVIYPIAHIDTGPGVLTFQKRGIIL